MTKHPFPIPRGLLAGAVLTLAVGVTLITPAEVLAQRGGGRRGGSVVSKSSPAFLAAFREATTQAGRATVRVRCDGKDVALGAVVEADGWILTKASELTGEPFVRLADGRELMAKVVGVHKQHDVALLKVEATGLTPVEWRSSKETPVGNWVISVGADGKPAAVGVVSVAARDVPVPKGLLAKAPPPNSGYLGIMLEPVEKAVKISQVVPNGGAAKAGLKANDLIVSVAGKVIEDVESLLGVLQRHKPGDVVHLKVKRGEEELELKAILGKRPPNRGEVQNNLGSKLSTRRSGFPTILQHDSVVLPNDCGGPLVDLDGKVIGLNISRAGRTESYAVPSEVLRPLLREMRAGKYAPPLSERAQSK